MTSDWELVEKYVAERSEASFRELVDRHIHWVHSAACRQVGDADLAKDVTQMVFSDLARKIRSLPHGTILGAWLHRATRYCSKRVLRSRRRLEERDQVHFELRGVQSTNPVDWTDISNELDSALDCLNRMDREAIVLRYFQQLDFRSIGADLGMTEDTAQKRVTRALEKLRTILGKRGVNSGVPALAAALGSYSVTNAPPSLAATITGIALSAVPDLSTTFLSTLAVMNLKIVTASLAIVGIGTSAYLLLRSNQELQLSNQGLRVQAAGLLEELIEARSTAQKTSGNTDDAASHAELLRLRGEVARLRRIESEDRKPAPAKALIPDGQAAAVLTDAGNATPEAAATTTIWALTQGLRDRFPDLLTEDPNVRPEVVVKRQDFLFGVMTKAFENRVMTGIDHLRTNEDGSINVYYGFRNRETGKNDTVVLEMRPSESGWRVYPGQPPPEL